MNQHNGVESAPGNARREDAGQQSVVIAPFLSGQYFCEAAEDNLAILSDEDAALYCAGIRSNGAGRINAALHAIGPKFSPSGRYQLGYTLVVPLFRYFKKEHGRWVFDAGTLKENLSAISDVDRPVVVYLSCNHFIDAGRALCRELAEDPVNLMWNRYGPMLPDTYFGSSIISWTLVDQNAPVNILRRQAFEEALEAICALPDHSRDRIVAISMLGEVHQMFAGFFGGPGFDSALSEGSDYAPIAVAGFRSWLAQSYGNISVLNRELEADYGSFDAIVPPSRDINAETLGSFFEHIDAHAAGTIAVVGWVHDSLGRELIVAVYLDGELLGLAETGLSRTDVTDVVPAIANPNVGFRLNLDYRSIAHGVHALEVLVRVAGLEPVRLARQPLVLVNRRQEQASAVDSIYADFPPISSVPGLSGALDGPRPWTPAFYNPLARLWLAYRNRVVRDYIERFARIAGKYRILKDKLFSHQVTPALIGSWNGDLLAADMSKEPSEFYNPGTTLYGGAAFGEAFLAMKKALGWDRYGVSEMHPSVPLAREEYLAMFEMHRANGAVFVAPYFMNVAPARLGGSGDGHDRFRIAPDNRRRGSDRFWQAIKDVMRQ
ncbi:MAG: hypothetical protein ACHQIL_01190 [Steroidobacterales bacterium]